MIEREIPGTPHPAPTGASYLPPAQHPESSNRSYLGDQIDDRTLLELLEAGATLGSGDGFAFDPAELIAIADAWDKLGARFAAKKQQARNLLHVHGPGAEYASAIHATAVQSTGKAMIAAFTNREQYCRDQAQKFRRTADKYAGTDDESSRSLPKPGSRPGRSTLR